MPRFPDLKEKGAFSACTVDDDFVKCLAMKWRDKRDVSMLTTMHDASFVQTQKIDPVTKERCNKPKYSGL